SGLLPERLIHIEWRMARIGQRAVGGAGGPATARAATPTATRPTSTRWLAEVEDLASAIATIPGGGVRWLDHHFARRHPLSLVARALLSRERLPAQQRIHRGGHIAVDDHLAPALLLDEHI